jgi:hypothetical protein
MSRSPYCQPERQMGLGREDSEAGARRKAPSSQTNAQRCGQLEGVALGGQIVPDVLHQAQALSPCEALELIMDSGHRCPPESVASVAVQPSDPANLLEARLDEEVLRDERVGAALPPRRCARPGGGRASNAGRKAESSAWCGRALSPWAIVADRPPGQTAPAPQVASPYSRSHNRRTGAGSSPSSSKLRSPTMKLPGRSTRFIAR